MWNLGRTKVGRKKLSQVKPFFFFFFFLFFIRKISYQTLACDVFSLLYSVCTFTVSISSLSCLHSAPHHISLLKQPPLCSPCQQFLNLCQSLLSIHSSHCIRVIFWKKKTLKTKKQFDYVLPRHPAHQRTYFSLFCACALLFPNSVPRGHLSLLLARQTPPRSWRPGSKITSPVKHSLTLPCRTMLASWFT